ncbi:hypothetical protein D1007_24641 [Hordeum vulgare]|nr:hypothetical protein D1007_24641 [Hordeum vulgare]
MYRWSLDSCQINTPPSATHMHGLQEVRSRCRRDTLNSTPARSMSWGASRARPPWDALFGFPRAATSPTTPCRLGRARSACIRCSLKCPQPGAHPRPCLVVEKVHDCGHGREALPSATPTPRVAAYSPS